MILVVHKHNSEKKVTKRHLFRIVRCLNRKPFTLNLTNPAKSPTTGPSSAFSHLNTSPNKGRVNMDFYNWADVVTMSLYSDRGNSLDINHFWFNGWPIKLGLHSRWKNNNSSTVFPWWSQQVWGVSDYGTAILPLPSLQRELLGRGLNWVSGRIDLAILRGTDGM